MCLLLSQWLSSELRVDIFSGVDAGQEQEVAQVEDDAVRRRGGLCQPQAEGQQDQDDVIRDLPSPGERAAKI